MSQKYRLGCVFSLVSLIGFSAALGAHAQTLPDGQGKAEFQRVCSACHAITMATSQHLGRSEWEGVIADMVSRGAQGSPEDLDKIATYLGTNFSKDTPQTTATAAPPVAAAAPRRARGGAAAAAVTTPVAPLSAGEISKAKELLSKNSCLSCHRVGSEGGYQAPDLTEIGSLRTAEQIHTALVSPNAELLPQNRLVHMVTRDGKTVDGKILNQDGFSVQMVDSSSHLVTYQKAGLREFTIVEKNPMPSYTDKMSAQDLADLVHYLSSLRP